MSRTSLKTSSVANDLVVNTGTAINARDGDPLRTAFTKLNTSISNAELNFIDLYTNYVSATGLATTLSTYATLASVTNSVQSIVSTASAATTIASATTIAPTNKITFISGTVQITTITVPASMASSGGQLTLIPTGAFTTATSGNIALGSTAVVSKTLIMTYDSGTNKWYPSY
jgi:hypothetical protein